jgi:hypothetical protein
VTPLSTIDPSLHDVRLSAGNPPATVWVAVGVLVAAFVLSRLIGDLPTRLAGDLAAFLAAGVLVTWTRNARRNGGSDR